MRKIYQPVFGFFTQNIYSGVLISWRCWLIDSLEPFAALPKWWDHWLSGMCNHEMQDGKGWWYGIGVGGGLGGEGGGRQEGNGQGSRTLRHKLQKTSAQLHTLLHIQSILDQITMSQTTTNKRVLITNVCIMASVTDFKRILIANATVMNHTCHINVTDCKSTNHKCQCHNYLPY